MANNKVIANGETLIDLTEDTVTPSNMVSGIVAHDASGARIVGTFDPSIFVQKSGDVMSGNLETPKVHHSEGTANNAYGYSLDKDGLTIEGNHISGDTYDKVFIEDTRIKLASGLYDADRDTKRLILNPSSINMYEYGDSTSIIRDKVEISKDRIKIHNYSGGDTSIGRSELTIGNKDILRTHQSLVGGWSTQIARDKDLNTTEFLEVRRFFCPQDVIVATLTNCPTGNAFMMDVFAPIQAEIDNESATSGSRYRVRKMLTWTGNEYIQICYWGSSGWAYGTWDKIVLNGSNVNNAVTWIKSNSYRVSSLDIAHSYADDQRAKIRFDLSTSSQTGGSNAIFGEGYVLTFMWDTTARWDTQFYLPDADGNAPAFRTYRPNSGWSAVHRFVLDSDYTSGTLTANTGSFSESYCRQAGRVVDIHAWLENLSTSTQTHERAIKVTGVSLPSVPVRFVCTCWLNNGIAAYAGYGVLATNGDITLVKGVANSNKVSFAISYVV